MLIEREGGFFAIEVKTTERISETDARHLKCLYEFLDKPLLGAMVLSLDHTIKKFGDKIWAVPVAYALGEGGDGCL